MARKKQSKKSKIGRRLRKRIKLKSKALKTELPKEAKVKKRTKPSSPSVKKIKLKKSVSSLPVYSKEPLHKTKIRVIGIGGGGGFVVSEIASRIKKASFVVANTDIQALKKLDKRAKPFQFGQELTYGLGTGMNSELGKIAAKEEKEKIKKLLEGQDLCILLACLGGGAGSGAAPIFAKISRDLGNLTYGIFTLPFKFEGEKKAQIARESLKKIKPYLNALSVIPNERIFQIIDKDTPLRAALSVINKNLAESLEGLIEMIYDSGLINIDFADLKTIFEGQGKITYLNTVEVSGPDRREEAIKKVISNPLYPYTIRGAKGVLFNIAGEKNLAMNEISQISKTISDLVNKEAKIIFGISQLSFLSMEGGKDKKGRDKIKITLLATGCRAKIFPQKPRKLRLKTSHLKLKPKKVRKKAKPSFSKTSSKKKSAAIPLAIKKPLKLLKKRRIKTLKIKPSTRAELGAGPVPHQKLRFGAGVKPKKVKTKHRQKNEKVYLSEIPGQRKKIEEKVEVKPVKNYKDIEKTQKEQISKEIKVRRSALQIKKEIEEAEQDLLDQEKKWETPAFLRKKLAKNE